MASMTVDFPEPLLPLKRFTYSLNSNILWLIPPQLFKHMRVKIFFVLLNFVCSFFLWDAKPYVRLCWIGRDGDKLRKTRFRYASLAAVLRVQERLVPVWLAGQLLPLLRSKDRPLLNVFLSLSPSHPIPLQVYDGFAGYLSNFVCRFSQCCW